MDKFLHTIVNLLLAHSPHTLSELAFRNLSAHCAGVLRTTAQILWLEHILLKNDQIYPRKEVMMNKTWMRSNGLLDTHI